MHNNTSHVPTEDEMGSANVSDPTPPATIRLPHFDLELLRKGKVVKAVSETPLSPGEVPIKECTSLLMLSLIRDMELGSGVATFSDLDSFELQGSPMNDVIKKKLAQANQSLKEFNNEHPTSTLYVDKIPNKELFLSQIYMGLAEYHQDSNAALEDLPPNLRALGEKFIHEITTFFCDYKKKPNWDDCLERCNNIIKMGEILTADKSDSTAAAAAAAAGRPPGPPNIAANMPMRHHNPPVPSVRHYPPVPPFNGIPVSQHVSAPDVDLINQRFAAVNVHHNPPVPSVRHYPPVPPFNGIPASQHVSDPDEDLINQRFAAAQMQRRVNPEVGGMFAPRHPLGLESNARGRVTPDNTQAPGTIPPQPQHDRSPNKGAASGQNPKTPT